MMVNTGKVFLVSMLLFAVVGKEALQADVLAFYALDSNFSSTDTDTHSTTTFSTPVTAHLGGTSSSNGSIVIFSGRTALQASSSATSNNAAVVVSQYLQFTITPDAGYQMTLTNITLDGAKASAGTKGFGIRSSLDGYSAFDLTGSSSGQAVTLTFQSYSFDLTDPIFEDITSAATFRIYVFNSAGTEVYFDNITLNGSVAAIPEPSGWAMVVLGMGLAGWVVTRERSRRMGLTPINQLAGSGNALSLES